MSISESITAHSAAEIRKRFSRRNTGATSSRPSRTTPKAWVGSRSPPIYESSSQVSLTYPAAASAVAANSPIMIALRVMAASTSLPPGCARA